MFTQSDPNQILTVEELCDRLSIARSTAYRLLRNKEITAFRVGGWKIPLSSVYEYINKKCDKK